jgi:predicted carbohydrate-binding protein with CBM5 and CBM33 domain
MAIRPPTDRGMTARRTSPLGGTRVRRARFLSLLVTALVAMVLTSLPSPAAAHGVAMSPGSRTYLCYRDMIDNGTPTNPACADAVAETGTTPLYNWFAVLDSNGGGKTEGYIPDGELCSGGSNGPFDFSSYNAARDDWPSTDLQAGSTIELQYSNWAAHPGDFDVYITKSGWSPTDSLGWGDLELLGSVTDPPQSGGAGSDGGHYYWDVTLPSDRTGQHILYVHWIRSDSQENFYSCSDVVLN